jgi:hypothetical protein
MARDTAAGFIAAAALLTGLGIVRAGEPVEPHRSANFVVHAPTPAIARSVADQAEALRKEIAIRWVGKDLPAWPRPCTIRLTLTPGPSGGSTALDYGAGVDGKPVVTLMAMQLRGDLRRLMTSTLPHELTHVFLAHHFGKPLPRWADEGIALLAESSADQAGHDARCRDLLNEGRGVRLRVLFRMMDYPRDLMAVYTQGHSVARFLLARTPIDGSASKPAALIEFVRRGAAGNTAEGWDRAAKEVYGFDSVDALEQEWLDWLKTAESVLTPKAAGHSVAPLARDVTADMIPPIRLPGSGQPVPTAEPTMSGGDQP